MKIFKAAILLSVVLFGSAHVYANDSVARIGAGGLVLMKSQYIRMAQEILEISPSNVTVQYKFINESNNDIQEMIAFPMPAYGRNAEDWEVNEGPVKSFKVFIHDVEVPFQIERKAMYKNKDITEQLRKIGLSDAQIFDALGDCKFDDGAKCDFLKYKSEISKLLGKYDYAGWIVEDTVYWNVTFPSGKPIDIRHVYVPLAGKSYTQNYDGIEIEGEGAYFTKDLPSGNSIGTYKTNDEACLDNNIRNAIYKKIQSRIAKGANRVLVLLKDVEYILGTGRNWKGAISSFKLRIVKSSSDQIVSLCFPGKPLKLDSRVFEFNHSNFVPQDKLVVHFYSVE